MSPRPSSSGQPSTGSSSPLASALSLLAVPPAVLALSLLLGAGILRQGAPLVVSGAAGALVLLPAMGIGLLFRRRILGLAVGLALWPMVVVVGFPLYFPGERADALASGATVLLMPFGLHFDAEHAQTVDALLPGAAPIRPVAPRASVLEAEPLPPATPTPTFAGQLADSEQVVIPYEGEGRTMAIQIGAEGPVLQRDLWMLFDTGATLTTLDHASLDALGVELSADAPEVTVRTAGGERKSHLALLDRIWIGGMEVEGVTVSVCEACADDDTVGLLGLNVSGLFRVTVDGARQELVLEPHKPPQNRFLDIAPWLQIEATATRWEDGRIEVEVRGRNISKRDIDHAIIGIRCEDTWTAELHNVPGGASASTIVSLPVGADCADYSVALERAYW